MSGMYFCAYYFSLRLNSLAEISHARMTNILCMFMRPHINKILNLFRFDSGRYDVLTCDVNKGWKSGNKIIKKNPKYYLNIGCKAKRMFVE